MILTLASREQESNDRIGKWWIAKHKNARLDGHWHWSRWLEQELGLLELKWDCKRPPHAKA